MPISRRLSPIASYSAPNRISFRDFISKRLKSSIQRKKEMDGELSARVEIRQVIESMKDALDCKLLGTFRKVKDSIRKKIKRVPTQEECQKSEEWKLLDHVSIPEIDNVLVDSSICPTNALDRYVEQLEISARALKAADKEMQKMGDIFFPVLKEEARKKLFPPPPSCLYISDSDSESDCN